MFRRILTIRSRRTVRRAVDDEVRFHIEMRADALLRTGAYPSLDEARAQAVREFGDVAAASAELTAMDECAAERRARADWWRDALQDAHYALRDFRRHPAFTGVIVAILALGIGSNAIPMTMQPAMTPAESRLDDRQLLWLQLLGRMQPGVTLAQATERSTAVIRQVLEGAVRTDPGRVEMPRDLEIVVGPGSTGFSVVREDFATPLVTMMVGVTLVLLIVCANVGSLLLARAVARSREMAVRMAIGAGRPRLVRQLLTESAVLAVIAGAASLVVARWESQLLLALASAGGIVAPLDVGLDLRVTLFTASISIAAVTLFGLAPAYRATRVDVAPVLRAHGRGSLGNGTGTGKRRSLTKTLVVGQVTLSLVLLIGAAMLVRSLRELERSSPGFDRDHLVVVDVDDQAVGYSGARHLAFVRELRARLAALPGVAGVSFSKNGLFSGSDWSTTITVPGFVPRTRQDSSARYDYVGPDYVRVIGARVVRGRDFTERDVDGSAPVVLVNEAMARYYFGTADPLGRTLIFTDSVDAPIKAQIVGVVSDTRTGESSWREGARSLTQPPVRRFYLSYLQHPGDTPPSDARFEIRTSGDPALLIDPVRRAVASVDAQVPINAAYTLDARIRDSIARERLVAKLSGGFGAVALMLAAIGLYGLMMHGESSDGGARTSHGVRRRAGGHCADGAGEALRLVGAGLAIGVPGGYAVTRLIRSQVPGVGAVDVPSIGVAFGVLVAAAVVAALIPAIRAGRVAPIVALQQE